MLSLDNATDEGMYTLLGVAAEFPALPVLLLLLSKKLLLMLLKPPSLLLMVVVWAL